MIPEYIKWHAEHAAAAQAEGWCIFEAEGSIDNTPLQLQRCDEAEILDSDYDAWALVKAGTQPHHTEAMALLKQHSLPEWVQIMETVE